MITGAGPNSEKMDFKIWEWSGNGAKDFIFVVFDTSGYAATD